MSFNLLEVLTLLSSEETISFQMSLSVAAVTIISQHQVMRPAQRTVEYPLSIFSRNQHLHNPNSVFVSCILLFLDQPPHSLPSTRTTPAQESPPCTITRARKLPLWNAPEPLDVQSPLLYQSIYVPLGSGITFVVFCYTLFPACSSFWLPTITVSSGVALGSSTLFPPSSFSHSSVLLWNHWDWK